MAAAKEDSAEKTFIASKHCTAAWNGDIAYFESLSAEGRASLCDAGFWLYSATDESKGRQVLVYLNDTKKYTLVPLREVKPVDHDTRLEPLFFAVANDRRDVVRYLIDLCASSPTLTKIATEPQFVTTVKRDNVTLPATDGSTTTATPYKYSLLLDGPASRPVTPLQVSIVNGHPQVTAMLQNVGKPPEDCRSCNNDCTVM